VSPKKTPRKTTKVRVTKTVRIDAKAWARLDKAARDLSKALGREVTVAALLVAGAEAVAAVSKTAAKTKRA